LNQAAHASQEVLGLLGLPTSTWENALEWYDHWLKGADNGVMARPAVTLQVKRSTERVGLARWPSDQIDIQPLFLDASDRSSQARLSSAPPEAPGQTRFFSSLDSGAFAGSALLFPVAETHLGVPVTAWLPAIQRSFGAVFQGPPIPEQSRICGPARVTLRASSSTDRALLVAYLYDVNPLGVGILISHGKVTLRGLSPGRVTTASIEMMADVYDVPQGHSLALVVDAFDALYLAPTLKPYAITLHSDKAFPSLLELPVLASAGRSFRS